MKTTLAIILAVSLTANVFFIYLIQSKSPASTGSTANTATTVGASNPDYERLNAAYQADETKIARIKTVLPIVYTLEVAAIDCAKFQRSSNQLFLSLEQIDTSKCPDDFQQGWLAYVQELHDNWRQGQRGKIGLLGDAALALTGYGAMAEVSAIKQVSSQPLPSDTAAENLERVLLKYGFHVHL